MQTFLPYESFRLSAQCLDYRRLGKQRVECMQILKAIKLGTGGWRNHPAVKMWKNYPAALIEYHKEIVGAWKAKGYKDTTLEKVEILCEEMVLPDTVIYPYWLGSKIHTTHRSNLLYKYPEHYKRFNWEEFNYPKKEYYWPHENIS